jgi:hypothetical protein
MIDREFIDRSKFHITWGEREGKVSCSGLPVFIAIMQKG